MPRRTQIALLAGVFAIAIGGCGGDNGTIPTQDSEELLNMLAQVESLVETGDCAVAATSAGQLTDAINELPEDVDPEVQSALTKGASNLLALTKDPDNCTGEGNTGEEGAQTTETETTESSTTETATSTVEQTSTIEEPTEETQPVEPTEGNQAPPTVDGSDQGPQGGGPGATGGGGGPASGGVDVPGGKR
jgi:hypothetical protein